MARWESRVNLKLIICLVIIQATLNPPCQCIEEDEAALQESREPAEYIEGFRVEPDLIEETIDDSLRSHRERQQESTSSSTQHPLEHICPYGYFACNNGECIAPRWRCDGHYDCDDFSDELNCTTLDLPQHSSIALPASSVYKAPPAPPPRPNASRTNAGKDGPFGSALGTQVYGLDFNSTEEPLMIFSTGTSIRGLWMRSRIYFDIVTRQKARTQVAATQPSITDAFSLFFGLFGADSQSGSGSGSGSGPASSGAEGALGGPTKAAPDSEPAQKPDNTIVGLDMDPANKEVYWVELGKQPGVYSAIIEDEQFQARHRRQFHGFKKVVEYGLLSPEDIALDSVGRNIYLTDAGLPAIVVCSIAHVNCRIMNQENIHKPRAIIADSATGWITFTDWGDRPGIYLQSMDGRHFETLIDSDVVWPNGLAADHASNHLYWADARLNKIEQVNLATRERRILVKETNTNPFSVSLFESHIFWSDWSKNEIKTCNKNAANRTQVLMHADDIYGIHIYHSDLDRRGLHNPCWSKHCSHLCLLSPGAASYAASLRASASSALSAACACPDTMALSILDKATCYEVELTFLLINVRNYVAQVYPERIGLRVVEEIVYSREHAIQDIAADWGHYRLFFFDAAQPTIYAADFAGRQPSFENITAVASKSIRGLLFDQLSDNLYWLEPDAGSLVMFSLKARFQRTLRRNLEQPTSMVLDSRNRLFYVAAHGARPHIMRLDMTGSEQSQILLLGHSREGLGLPVALHLDEQAQRLYWADAHRETIESVELDIKSRTNGTKLNSRLVHKRRLGVILSFAVYHDSFMWTLQNDGFLYKSKINAKKSSRPIVFRLPPNPSQEHLASDYKRLITVNPLFEATTSSCHTTPCSHACILDSSHAAKCVCPENFKLSALNRTNCIAQNHVEFVPSTAPASTSGPLSEGSHVAPGTPPPAPPPPAAASMAAAAVPASGAGADSLHNLIAHLDNQNPNHAPAWTSDGQVASLRGHEMVVKPHEHEQEVMGAASAQHGHEEASLKERPSGTNHFVWLIVFLLCLSGAAVAMMVMLHRQGRLPSQLTVSFVAPGSSRSPDKAMLLLDSE